MLKTGLYIFPELGFLQHGTFIPLHPVNNEVVNVYFLFTSRVDHATVT